MLRALDSREARRDGCHSEVPAHIGEHYSTELQAKALQDVSSSDIWRKDIEWWRIPSLRLSLESSYAICSEVMAVGEVLLVQETEPLPVADNENGTVGLFYDCFKVTRWDCVICWDWNMLHLSDQHLIKSRLPESDAAAFYLSVVCGYCMAQCRVLCKKKEGFTGY